MFEMANRNAFTELYEMLRKVDGMFRQVGHPEKVSVKPDVLDRWILELIVDVLALIKLGTYPKLIAHSRVVFAIVSQGYLLKGDPFYAMLDIANPEIPVKVKLLLASPSSMGV